MSESIPLSFEAVDNLSQAVASMTAMLERMGAAQEDTTKATEDATKATDDQAKSSSRFGDVLVKVNAGVELAKSAYEALGGTIEWVKEGLNTSLEKWDEQSKKLGVSASALGSIAEANNKLTKTQDKTYASIGKIIDRSGVFQTKAILQTEALKEFNTWLDKNSESISKFGTDLAISGSDKLRDLGVFIRENSESLARFQIYLEGVGGLVVTTGYGVSALAQALKIGLYAAVSGAATALVTLSEGLIEILRLAGQDVPQALEDMRLGLKELESASAKGAIDSFDELNRTVDKTGEKGAEAFGKIATAATGSRAEIAGQIEGWNKAGDAVIGYGDKARKSLEKVGKGKGRKDLIDAETAAEEKRQTVLLDYDRRLLEAQRAQNEELVIQLTKEKALVEARQSLKDIKTKELRDATLTVAELQAQIEYEQSLKDLAQKRRDERAAAHDIEMQRRQEVLDWDTAQDEKARERYELAIARIQGRYDRETELLVGMGDLIGGALGHVPDLLNEISDSTNRMLGGFGKAASGISPLITSMRAFNKTGATAKDQQDAINAGLQAGVGILGGVTEAFVEDKRKQAGIEALINAAAAAASYATGNVPAGIGYTAAAVTYGAAAAFGGGSAPSAPAGASGSSGGSSGASGSLGMIDLDRERSLNAEAIAEAFRSEGRGGAPQIVVQLSGNVIAGESPESARIITDLITRDLEALGFRRT